MKKNNEDFAGLRVGIDIGSKTIKLVEIREVGKELVLENFDIIDIPQEDNGTKAHTAAKLLKEAFSRLSAEKRSVFSLITGPEVIIRRLSLPKMSENDLLEAIKWEIRSHISFPVEEAAVDYYPLVESSKVSGKTDIIMVAMKKSTLEAALSIFEAANIKLDVLTVTPFASWDLLKKLDALQKNKSTVLVNVGSETTKLTFFNGENLEFYREFSIAGDSFTKAMIGLFVSDSWQMNMTYAQAEEIKKLYGIPDENTEEKTSEGIPLIQILQIVKPVLRRFMNEIVRSFSYYKEHFGKEAIERILLTGGSSELKNLSSTISQGLDSKIEDLSGLIKLKIGKNIKDEKKLASSMPLLTTALGASVPHTPSINLLKKTGFSLKTELPFGLGKIIQSLNPESLKNISTLVTVSAAAFMIIAGILAAVVTNTNIETYKKNLNEKKLLLEDLRNLSEHREILAQIEKGKSPVKECIAELANLMPSNTYLNSLLFDGKTKSMIIEGTCANMASVSALMKNIETSPFFGNTTLNEARRSAVKNGISFKIAFNISL